MLARAGLWIADYGARANGRGLRGEARECAILRRTTPTRGTPLPDVFDTLKERGFIFLVSDEERLRAALEQGPVTAYAGYDPSAPSLHMGHLVSIMMLAHLQRAGHRPIVVVGGGTGMIGDPTDKTEMRKLLTLDEIQANMAGLRPQF